MPEAREKTPRARISIQSAPPPAARIELGQRRGVQQVGEATALFQRRVSPPKETEFIKKGDLFLNTGEADKSIEEYQKALKFNPRASDALIGWCQALIELEKFDEAEVKYADIFKLSPKDASAHISIGATFYRAGYIDKAIEEYKKALTLQDYQPLAHFNLGMAYAHEGKFDLAKEQYLTALSQHPKFSEAHNNLGLIYEQTETSPDAAVAQFSKAAKNGYAFAHYNLGRIYERRRDFEKAIKEFEQAIRVRNNFAEAYLNLGNVRLQRSQLQNVASELDKAIEDFKKAIDLRDNFYPLAHENLAIALTLKKDMAAAFRSYRTALTQYDGASVIAFSNLVSSLKGEQTFVIGNELAKSDNPGNLRSKKDAGAEMSSAERMANLKKKLEVYEEIDDGLKNSPDVRYCAGIAYFLTEKNQEAIEELQEAVKLSNGTDREAKEFLKTLSDFSIPGVTRKDSSADSQER